MPTILIELLIPDSSWDKYNHDGELYCDLVRSVNDFMNRWKFPFLEQIHLNMTYTEFLDKEGFKKDRNCTGDR